MSFIDRLFHRPEPAPVRYVVATRQESRKARIARIHTTLQLEVAVARLSPAEKEEAIARASSKIEANRDRGSHA